TMIARVTRRMKKQRILRNQSEGHVATMKRLAPMLSQGPRSDNYEFAAREARTPSVRQAGNALC
ncbi:hypothetical protein, partial [Bradyrhizobium sp. SUTN9-2]|uniref:hypothetical protein n=1 Tax=Bradyrhizobium sp. SUTN9-2 TaxID=1167456 RepID=UPI00195E80B4